MARMAGEQNAVFELPEEVHKTCTGNKK